MDLNDDFELAIDCFSDEVKEIARAARKLIYEVFPPVVEVVWIRQRNTGFGTGIKKKTEHFCWLMPAATHVNLGFNYGTELPDPHHLLQGTGKLFRHYKLKSVADVSNPDLRQLVDFATTYRVTPLKT